MALMVNTPEASLMATLVAGVCFLSAQSRNSLPYGGKCTPLTASVSVATVLVSVVLMVSTQSIVNGHIGSGCELL